MDFKRSEVSNCLPSHSGNHSCSAGSVKYNDTESCWGPLRRKDAYRVFLVSAAAPVTNTQSNTRTSLAALMSRQGAGLTPAEGKKDKRDT